MCEELNEASEVSIIYKGISCRVCSLLPDGTASIESEERVYYFDKNLGVVLSVPKVSSTIYLPELMV